MTVIQGMVAELLIIRLGPTATTPKGMAVIRLTPKGMVVIRLTPAAMDTVRIGTFIPLIIIVPITTIIPRPAETMVVDYSLVRRPPIGTLIASPMSVDTDTPTLAIIITTIAPRVVLIPGTRIVSNGVAPTIRLTG